MEDRNTITLIGIVAKVEASHEIYGEKFYKAEIVSERTSGVSDFVPVIISERITDIDIVAVGTKVKIIGDIRTKNENRHLIMYVNVKEVLVVNDDTECVNDLYINGFLCKQPIYRETPLGREIGDLLVAVNRKYGKSSYVPAVVWGKNARYADSLEAGTGVMLHGRFQSRVYRKDNFYKTVYEISCNTIEVSE